MSKEKTEFTPPKIEPFKIPDNIPPRGSEENIARKREDPRFSPVRFDSKAGTLDFGGSKRQPRYSMEVGKNMATFPDHLIHVSHSRLWYTKKMHNQVAAIAKEHGWKIADFKTLLGLEWDNTAAAATRNRANANA